MVAASPVAFTKPAAKRIASVVRRVERTPAYGHPRSRGPQVTGDGFWAKVTARGTGAFEREYSWKELNLEANGTFSEVSGGLEGTAGGDNPAFEINESRANFAGSLIVWMWPGDDGAMLFDRGLTGERESRGDRLVWDPSEDGDWDIQQQPLDKQGVIVRVHVWDRVQGTDYWTDASFDSHGHLVLLDQSTINASSSSVASEESSAASSDASSDSQDSDESSDASSSSGDASSSSGAGSSDASSSSSSSSLCGSCCPCTPMPCTICAEVTDDGGCSGDLPQTVTMTWAENICDWPEGGTTYDGWKGTMSLTGGTITFCLYCDLSDCTWQLVIRGSGDPDCDFEDNDGSYSVISCDPLDIDFGATNNDHCCDGGSKDSWATEITECA